MLFRSPATNQTNHGANGQVNTTGDDHNSNADADDTEQGGTQDQSLHVVGRQKAGAHHGSENEYHQKNA